MVLSLRKLVSALALTCRVASPQLSQVTLDPAVTLTRTLSVRLNMGHALMYSQRLVFSEAELRERSQFLAAQFGSMESEMRNFLDVNRRLVTMGRDKFYQMSKLLVAHGISKRDLTSYPEVYRRKVETIATRLRMLEKVKVRPVPLHLVNLSHNEYRKCCSRFLLDAEAVSMFDNTTNFLSTQLGFSESEAKAAVKESMWLNTSKLRTLKEKADLFTSYGIPPQALKKRIWVLGYQTSLVKSRLDALKDAGLSFKDSPDYLVAITASDEKFLKFKARLLENKAILADSGCRDRTDYICLRLQCSKADVELMRSKYTGLLSLRLPKLKNNLDVVLNDFNLPPTLFLESPRILRFSTATLRERLLRLREADIPVSNSVLGLTNGRFDAFILHSTAVDCPQEQ